MSLNVNTNLYTGINQSTFGDVAQATLAQAQPQAAALVQDGVIDARSTPESQATEMFQQQFGDLAQDKDAFHALMKKVYGESYDAGKAETYRQMALKGDYSFLPPVKFVSRETLNGANGAYNAEEGVIYIAEDLKNNPSLMQQTFVEEAGHHLDQMLNPNDSMGDEGELFRRLMSGEKLSEADIASIRAENDKGTIMVDGKAVEVEFWNPIGAIVDGAKAVGGAIKDAAKKVGGAIKDVGSKLMDGAMWLGDKMMAGLGKLADGGVWLAGKTMGPLSRKLWAGVKAAGGFFKEAGLAMWDGIKNLPDMLKSLGSGIKSLGGKIMDGLMWAGDKMMAGLGKLADGGVWLAGKTVGPLARGMWDGVSWVGGKIGDAFGKVF